MKSKVLDEKMKVKQKLVDFEGNLRTELLTMNPKEQMQRVYDIITDGLPFAYQLVNLRKCKKEPKTGEEDPQYIIVAYDGERAIAVYPRAYGGDKERIESYRIVDIWGSECVVYDDDIDDGWVVYEAILWTPVVYTGPGTHDVPDGMVVVQVKDNRTGYPVRYMIEAKDELDIIDIDRLAYYGKRVAYYQREMDMYGCMREGWVDLSEF